MDSKKPTSCDTQLACRGDFSRGKCPRGCPGRVSVSHVGLQVSMFSGNEVNTHRHRDAKRETDRQTDSSCRLCYRESLASWTNKLKKANNQQKLKKIAANFSSAASYNNRSRIKKQDRIHTMASRWTSRYETTSSARLSIYFKPSCCHNCRYEVHVVYN